jgi:hypothetical protein
MLIIGKFTCLYRNDWQKGLPMLAKAGDTKWAAAAQADIASPADAAAEVSVGDKWYDLADSLMRFEQSAVRVRASIWYGRAVKLRAPEA